MRFFNAEALAVEVEGRPVLALFSGDTIIDRDHWGDQPWRTSGAGWHCP